MEDDATQPPMPEISEAILAETVDRLKTRGGRIKECTHMQLPADLLAAFCGQLLMQQNNILGAAAWLAGECAARGIATPSRSSAYRFAPVVFEEYNLAKLAHTQGISERYLAALTEGDPHAVAMTAKNRMGELLTDFLMRAQSLEAISDERLFAVTSAVKAVATIGFDRTKMDARIAALEKLNEEREATIRLKEQAFKTAQMKFDEALKALKSKVETTKGGKITPEDIADVRRAIFG